MICIVNYTELALLKGVGNREWGLGSREMLGLGRA